MRTTLDIDDTVLATAKQLARARGHTIGMVISELAQRALESNRQARRAYRQFPVLDVPADAAALRVECVEAIVANEGLPPRR
ncbi:antitoxin [Steroidobacter flavus]|uniref:Antitoxin n=1 Tax=Steroidobacter flavus TaxID=1842136 RepID=A0ABV8T291_9GAMM